MCMLTPRIERDITILFFMRVALSLTAISYTIFFVYTCKNIRALRSEKFQTMELGN